MKDDIPGAGENTISGAAGITLNVGSSDVDVDAQDTVAPSATVNVQTSVDGSVQGFLTDEQFKKFMEHQKQAITQANIQKMVQDALKTAIGQLNLNPKANTSTPDAVKTELKAFEDYEINHDNVVDSKFDMIEEHINEHEFSEDQHFQAVEAREAAHEQYNEDRFQEIEEKIQRLEAKALKERGYNQGSVDARIRRFLPTLVVNSRGLDESSQAKIPPRNDAFVIHGADDKMALQKFMLIQTLLIAHRVPYKFWFYAAQVYFENELVQCYNELVTEGASWYDLAVMLLNMQNWDTVNVLATREYHEMKPFPGEFAVKFISRYRAAVNRTVMYKNRFVNEKLILLGKLHSQFSDALVKMDFERMSNADEFYAMLRSLLSNRVFKNESEVNMVSYADDFKFNSKFEKEEGESLKSSQFRRHQSPHVVV